MRPPGLKYTRTHEWCRKENEFIVVGITEHALQKISAVLSVELPDVGDDVLKEIPLGEIETLEATLELHSPVDGEVIAVNARAMDQPELLTKDPYDEGWLIKLRPSDPAQLDQLLSDEQYAKELKQQR